MAWQISSSLIGQICLLRRLNLAQRLRETTTLAGGQPEVQRRCSAITANNAGQGNRHKAGEDLAKSGGPEKY